jgi:RNA polymerase-interacting CarD/CdnL/TRCF family regulator
VVEREDMMKRFEVGSRVVEPTYGLGSVIAVEDAYTRVQFDEHGVKKFLTSMSKLEPSDEPAPAGARGLKTRKKRTVKKVAAPAPVVEAPEEEEEAES